MWSSGKRIKGSTQGIKAARDEMGDGIRSGDGRVPKDRQIGEAWLRDGRGDERGEEGKRFDVTPCIRLVALLIAHEPHFYPSRDVLERSPPPAIIPYVRPPT